MWRWGGEGLSRLKGRESGLRDGLKFVDIQVERWQDLESKKKGRRKERLWKTWTNTWMQITYI